MSIAYIKVIKDTSARTVAAAASIVVKGYFDFRS